MTKFSKKHYTAVGNLLKDVLADVSKGTTPAVNRRIVSIVFYRFNAMFKDDNKSFNEEAFKKTFYGG